MYRNERTRNIILIVLAVCLIGITVAYATLSQNLNISGVANVNKTSWNIHFTNVLTPKVEGQATGGKATLNDNSTILTISEGTLSAPGDKITYTFDVINEGDLPAEVETTLTQMESCTAEDGSDVSIFCNKIGLDLVYAETKEKVQKSDRLLSGETKTLNLIITYDKDKLLTSLPTSPITLSNITSTINYTMLTKEKSNTPIVPEKKVICKRATTLHTEECTQTSVTYNCSGAGYTSAGSKGTSTITYGNLGTSGSLTSGDAFDCDVNGDGVYDSNTERFYYVSDYYNTSTKSFESDTAVLIYYNNVSTGNPNNNKLYAYDSSGENWHGPRAAIVGLPTTSQWNNVSLKNTIRAILNENGSNTTTGGMTPSNFSYAGYAARFLTIQEVRQGTGMSNIPTWQTGELDKFIYLLENTKFSNSDNAAWALWLENVRLDTSTNAWYVHGNSRLVSHYSVSFADGFGVRPAIEVSKTNMEY